MKKRYIILISLLFFILFASVSNPSKDDYVSFVKEEIVGEGHPFIGMISGPFINTLTTKKNFGLFTLYVTTFDEEKNDKIIAIGLLNNFVWIKGFPEDSPKKIGGLFIFCNIAP